MKLRDNMDISRGRKAIAERLGLLHEDQGKAPVKERLGMMNEPRATHRAGGHTHPRNKLEPPYVGKTPIMGCLGWRVEIQEPVEAPCSRRRGSKCVTLDNANKALHPQREMCSSDDDNVIP